MVAAVDWGTFLIGLVTGLSIAWQSLRQAGTRLRRRNAVAVVVLIAAYLLGAVAIARWHWPYSLAAYYGLGAGFGVGVALAYAANRIADPPRPGRVRVTKRP